MSKSFGLSALLSWLDGIELIFLFHVLFTKFSTPIVEIFSSFSKPVAITVSELNKYIKNKVDEDEFLNNVYVKGEISNFKHHYTGHMYFTLKDESSLIKCVMFKSSTATLNFIPKDGMKVFVFGTLAVYEAGGVYQIYCKAMQEDRRRRLI